MLGAQLGEELGGVWDVALEHLLQPGQGGKRGRNGGRDQEGDGMMADPQPHSPESRRWAYPTSTHSSSNVD